MAPQKVPLQMFDMALNMPLWSLCKVVLFEISRTETLAELRQK